MVLCGANLQLHCSSAAWLLNDRDDRGRSCVENYVQFIQFQLGNISLYITINSSHVLFKKVTVGKSVKESK